MIVLLLAATFAGVVPKDKTWQVAEPIMLQCVAETAAPLGLRSKETAETVADAVAIRCTNAVKDDLAFCFANDKCSPDERTRAEARFRRLKLLALWNIVNARADVSDRP